MKYNILYWDIYMIRSLYIYPEQEEDEQKFCQLLAEEANIGIENEFLLLQPMGVRGCKIQLSSLEDNHEKEDKIRTLIDALEKVQCGELLMESKIGCRRGGQIISVAFDFQEPELVKKFAKVLNIKEQGKRKRSVWRNPTPPKNKSKIGIWKSIYA